MQTLLIYHPFFAHFNKNINHPLLQLPFCILADHTTKSIVISIRGSLSFRDIFTDLTANSEKFDVPGVPPDSSAHKGMLAAAAEIHKRLKEGNLLDRVMSTYPEYNVTLTGHSLGKN